MNKIFDLEEKKMKKKDAPAQLYFFAGILLILAGIIGNTVAFIPIGCCFIIIGIGKIKK